MLEDERVNANNVMKKKEIAEEELKLVSLRNSEIEENLEKCQKQLKFYEIDKNTENSKLEGVKAKYDQTIKTLN